MSNKEAYKEKIRAQLDEWKAEADKLRARIKQKQAEGKIDSQKYLDELKVKQSKARAKLEELEDAGEDAWEDIKKGLEKATADLKETYSKAKRKFS
ncbi:hypothetical protein [Rhodohalobacter sulfatireducens]|uniref:Coiled coil domain-containing protein n=1 Tax=Rhodohalobacter sulfatireducens TaxID=2911366 RepID=A0ABS9KI82_9BACT|nr:hypothetical protein [Rhodohalobacter sulfatireducens]MCG2590549.1 hypothetical protein [Rhodohalobacter sulfatireducens]MDR9365836.1 hypothetical protein [Balneolaceae bacterium]MDR9410130.1 hypothetical protein [Balneolaceae bacterium]